MSESSLVTWMQRQGHRTVRTHSSDWAEIGPGIFQAVPYHHLIDPGPGEFDEIFKRQRAVGLRYSTSLAAPTGAASYHVVYREPDYLFTALHKKVRHDVARAQKSAVLEQISFERLAEEGWLLRYETLARQARTRAENETFWKKLCASAASLPGFETWAVTIGGKLAAALIALTQDNCCSVLYQQSRTDYLPLGVNNLLTFQFTNEVLERPGGMWIFYGLHSLDAPASVDKFKLRMGFAANPVRQRVMFNPLIAPLFNPLTYAMIKKLRTLRPENPTLGKVEGMMRFYLQGFRPLAKQDWPENLLDQRDQLLAAEANIKE